MQSHPFGVTNLPVTPLGYGAAPVAFLDTEQNRVATILNLVLDSGVTLIDTAAGYPGSEEAIGSAVGHRRGEFVLVSKCGQSFPDLPGEAWSPEVITATIDRSLKRLRTDHLDVVLLHSCARSVLEQGDALDALVAARDAGKIRFAGYSGDNETAAYAASLPEIAVLETSVSIADQINIDLVLPTALERNLGVLAKRPVANAAWKSPDDQKGLYVDYTRDYHERLKTMAFQPADFDIADWGELALRFTLSIPGVHTAIIGTTNPDNARKNVAAVEKGPLPQDAVEAIRGAFLEAKGEKDWPGLT